MMADDTYKRYTLEARRGIKGEAFFESLIVEHAIPHRIARQNDLEVDFLCEFVYGDRPTGLLFSAQVKTTTTDQVTPASENREYINHLELYTLNGAKTVDQTRADASKWGRKVLRYGSFLQRRHRVLRLGIAGVVW